MPRSFLVAVSALSFAKNQTLVTELKALGAVPTLNTTGTVLQGTSLAQFLASTEAEIAIVGTELITSDVLDACPKLKLIAKYGVGLDNLDQAELAARGIKLAWTAGVNKRSVSELVLAFALGHFHKATVAINGMRRGVWTKDGGVQLTNLRVGIVGLGHVGLDLAQLLSVFGSEIVYTDIIDRSSVAPINAKAVSYQDLVATSDLISFHVPATPLTAKMFASPQLSFVKKTALVVNTSRGSVVDLDATCSAVLLGTLGGFAADVYPSEPFTPPPTWASCEQLYFTPHIGGNTREAVLAMGRSAIAGIKSWLV